MNNSGVITDIGISVAPAILSKYINGRHALVTQGGGQKGIFTAGVLDSFLEASLDPFDVFYGTSAGALNITAYLCRQRGLGKHFITDLTTRPEFFRLFKHIRRKQRLDLDWAFEQLQSPPYWLDMDAGRFALGERKAFAAVTNVDDLHDEYLSIMDGDNWSEALKATCAIPALYRHEVSFNGKNYVDGGVSAAIPAQEAWRQGARMITVIRTESVDLDAEVDSDPVQNGNSFLNKVGLDQHFEAIQNTIANKAVGWREELSNYVQNQFTKSLSSKKDVVKPLLNGGRWLFGSGDVYRLCHLLGDQFDAGLMDLMLVHHQTFTLTHNFMLNPPDDCFVVQIAPEEPLRSSPLLSKPEDLEFDYQLGLQAGRNYIAQFSSLSSHPNHINDAAYTSS